GRRDLIRARRTRRHRDGTEYRKTRGGSHLRLGLDDLRCILSKRRRAKAEAEARQHTDEDELQRLLRTRLPWKRREVDHLDPADLTLLAHAARCQLLAEYAAELHLRFHVAHEPGILHFARGERGH